MRLLKLGVYHPAYLRQFYAARPAPAAEAYAAQHAALIRDGYGSSDFWTSALAQLGYETCDTIANAEPLQRGWAREQNFACADDGWLFQVTTAQVKAFRPDVIIVADYSIFDAAFIRRLREECPFIRLILGWCGAPYHDASVFGAWDIVLSCVPELVAHFRRQGHRSHHLNHAFEPRLLDRIDTASPPNADFTFIGSVLKQNQFHVGREKILKLLVGQTDLQIWSDIKRPTKRGRRGTFARRLAHRVVGAAAKAGVPESLLSSAPLLKRAARWEPPPAPAPEVDERIARRARPPLFGLAMFQQLRDSRSTLNTHIDISTDSASNMRLFEATGVGACLVTDWKENLPQLFEPDTEVLTYRGAEECAEKVTYVLAHEEQRSAIAAAGQRRTLRDHNFTHRAARIDEIIRAALSKP